MIKRKQTELDVDFIGGQGPLTTEDEKAISEFIKADKAKRALLEKHPTKTRTSRSSKTTA